MGTAEYHAAIITQCGGGVKYELERWSTKSMLTNGFKIDVIGSWDYYDEYRDEPTAAELFVERAKERIRKRVYRLLVWVYAVPVLIGYVAIDALKQKVYAMEAKRGRPFGYSYRVYKGRGVNETTA